MGEGTNMIKDFFKQFAHSSTHEAENNKYFHLIEMPMSELTDSELIWLVDYIKDSAQDNFSAIVSASIYSQANLYQQERIWRLLNGKGN